MFYPHLRGRGFKETSTGPVIYKGNISIALKAGQTEYSIEEKSPIERNYLVGLWITPVGAKTGASTTQVTQAILDSIVLIFRVDDSDVYRKLPLGQVLKCNDNGRPFYVSLPGRVNLSESMIKVFDNAAIVAGTVLEFQVDYAKKSK